MKDSPRRKPAATARCRARRCPRKAGGQARRIGRRPRRNEDPLMSTNSKPNQVIATSFLVQSKEIRQKKGGELYLSLFLGDRTGELDAKMWDNVAEVLNDVRPRRFRQGQGHDPDLPEPAAADHSQDAAHGRERSGLRRLLPVFEARPGGDVARAARHRRRHGESASARALLEAIFDDPDIAARYRSAPAAKQIHHAFLGGLIEHVLSVCGWRRSAARALPDHRLRPAAHRRDPARHRQDLRAELRARLRLLERGPAARPHLDRDAHGGGQAARPARISRRCCAPWWST